jgi:hypothetical protein
MPPEATERSLLPASNAAVMHWTATLEVESGKFEAVLLELA